MRNRDCLAGMQEEKQCWLVLDASSPCVQVGVLQEGTWVRLERKRGEALETLFPLVRQMMGMVRDGNRWEGILFCEGPGSILGLRVAAMAVETWRVLPPLAGLPLRVYNSLALAAACLGQKHPGEGVHVVSDFRQGIWNAWSRGAGGDPGIFRQIPTPELPRETAGKCYYLPQRKSWEALPGHYQVWDYDLGEAGVCLADMGLSEAVSECRLFHPSPQGFKLWTGERHRG